MSKVRSATESVIRAEELELLEDGMNIDSDVSDPSKPDFPALSALDAMVSQQYACRHKKISKIFQSNWLGVSFFYLGRQDWVQKNSLPT